MVAITQRLEYLVVIERIRFQDPLVTLVIRRFTLNNSRRGISSSGRAIALQAIGGRFESGILHSFVFAAIAQRQSTAFVKLRSRFQNSLAALLRS